jgi:hypothetical protein
MFGDFHAPITNVEDLAAGDGFWLALMERRVPQPVQAKGGLITIHAQAYKSMILNFFLARDTILKYSVAGVEARLKWRDEAIRREFMRRCSDPCTIAQVRAALLGRSCVA